MLSFAYNFAQGQDSTFRNEYLCLIVYGVLLVYMLVPLPIFKHKGRLYLLKLMGKCFVAFCYGVDFPIAFMTNQWISMITPIRDLTYSVCYYLQVDFNDPKNDACKSISPVSVASIVIVVAFACRFFQLMRNAIDLRGFTMEILWRTARVVTSVIAAILGYLYANDTTLLIPWIAMAAVSTIVSYYTDVKVDWDLFQTDSKNFLLRDYLTFAGRKTYYAIVVGNFILRLSWTLTLSPSIANILGNANLVALLSGAL